jgi:hypothetical protein
MGIVVLLLGAGLIWLGWRFPEPPAHRRFGSP